MEIVLTDYCIELQGTLRPEYGYFIVRRGEKFFAQRSRHLYNPDGHWRFIKLCTEMARNNMYIYDVKIEGLELYTALLEFGIPPRVALVMVDLDKEYSAEDIGHLIKKYKL